MDLKSLKTFKLIATNGSFQQAAQEQNYAQSTVTMQIKKLEEDLGVKLFERGKKIALTEAGRVLLEEITPLLFSAESIRQKLTSYDKGEAGMIRMGAIEPTTSLMLPSVIVPFLKDKHHVKFELEIGNTNNLGHRVARGELDFAICSIPSAEENLVFTQWFEETLGLLVPEHHPLANREVINFSDLTGERLLFPGQNSACRHILETYLMKQGKNLYSTIAIGSTEMLKKAVVQGLGLAIVPVISDKSNLEGTVLRKVNDMQLSYPIGLVQRKNQIAGNLQTALLNALRRELTAWKTPW
ncbi:LysR family transcriptional regulator [Priestia megaterium]|uniref:LysR family transcriptional regulator n=1 Tax=Priestia megaterium TaxID=1404 RepID=UPI000D506548|nr:LysR family transcriptional regulator [Priestia megaterium]PVE64587.1 LysR family transcriptional regulator [Priestia megaterium]PVE83445.1 LysR family transcriptional regulator [Priestia megaterium]PVE88572.1 LysR family transcriptional regulator [Priestia megaterium]PVE97465.1 LysR family transcriptional regulator [Priestia megaterium]